ncbi:MAG: sigma-70 family RNA polymerase sigma factor [Pseudomonadota bacterium]
MSVEITTSVELPLTERIRLQRWVGSLDRADDVRQIVAEKLLVKGAAPNQGYLMRMLRNTAIDIARSEKTRQNYEQAFATEAETLDLLSPERQLQADQMIVALQRAVSELQPLNQEIFLRAFLDEQPRREIARELGLKQPTVEKRLAKARQHCLHRLREHLVDP